MKPVQPPERNFLGAGKTVVDPFFVGYNQPSAKDQVGTQRNKAKCQFQIIGVRLVDVHPKISAVFVIPELEVDVQGALQDHWDKVKIIGSGKAFALLGQIAGVEINQGAKSKGEINR